MSTGISEERFSVVGEPLKKCVITRCNIWVNSRRLIRENWVPVCTDDHHVRWIQELAGSTGIRGVERSSRENHLMEILGRR